MAPETLISRTEQHVRQACEADSSGHDWWHIHRVRQTALRLAREEQANLLIVELAALLHDLADWKIAGGDETAGPRAATEWLRAQEVPADVIDHVAQIIADLSFKGAGVSTPMRTLEGQVVQDADRLDAIGAIGVARAFAFGGHRGRAMYDPAIPPELHASFEAYKRNQGPTINHFYEKLLLLRERMNTATGRRVADERHAFMERFLAQFFLEWDGAG